jgi:hypothetical protein
VVPCGPLIRTRWMDDLHDLWCGIREAELNSLERWWKWLAEVNEMGTGSHLICRMSSSPGSVSLLCSVRGLHVVSMTQLSGRPAWR